MILFGTPRFVQNFYRPVTQACTKPVAAALVPMILALLLAPHLRSCGTLAEALDVHPATISRRLRGKHWDTGSWYDTLFGDICADYLDWEGRLLPPSGRRHTNKPRRQFVVVIDPTQRSTLSRCMENLTPLGHPKSGGSTTQTSCHYFVLGLLLTETGGRFPLPRKSYYTEEYCKKHGKRYRTQVQLAAQMVREVARLLPADADVTVVMDSAFDAAVVHGNCRQLAFRFIVPVDPNRIKAEGPEPEARGCKGEKVVAEALSWPEDDFHLFELQHDSEAHALARRRHRDNLRAAKTHRRYAVAAHEVNVHKVGRCLVVVSYKENPQVQVVAPEDEHWQTFHKLPIISKKQSRPCPKRWHRLVLLCTDVAVSARQVVEWYELRWQIELFFRELKSRLQLCRYQLQSFAAVERYVDLILLGLLLLESLRLRGLKRQRGRPKEKDPWVHERTTDLLRALEAECQSWNVEVVRRRLRTVGGRCRLLEEFQQLPCHVA